MRHRRVTESLDGAESETDVIAFNAEPDIRFIDVRRQDVLPSRTSLGYIVRDLGLVVTEDSEERGIELNRIMGLEIGRLIRDVRITSSMRFIKAIDDTLAFAIFSIPRREGLDYIIISSWKDCTLNNRGFLLYI